MTGYARLQPFPLITPDLTGVPLLRSRQLVEQVPPIGVAVLDQIEFPLPAPAPEALLVPDTVDAILTALCPDQTDQSAACAEVGAGAGSVLMDTGAKV